MSNKRHDFAYKEKQPHSEKLLYISSAVYDADWHSVAHTHYFSELFFILEGSGQFIIENSFYPVSTNDLIIVKPNVFHTEVSDTSSPLKYIVLGIEGLDLTPSTSKKEDVLFCITNLYDIRDTILFYLRQMLNEVEKKQPGHDILCQNFIENLIVILNRHPRFSNTLLPASTKKSSHLGASVRHYIDNHYKEEITLDSMAEIVHSSKYHIIHTFTEEYGVSPIKYLISKRINESCYLLESTDHSLASISQLLGFSSPSYFSQTFKKEMNCSPMEYRKKSQNNFQKTKDR